MKTSKQTIIFGLAIFASLFGAGNLILPPFLGFKAGEDWWLVALGFSLSAIVIPILAIFAYAKLQGTMLDFGKKVSPLFSLCYCLCVYLIAISLPIPRTAAVTHEMAIQPYFGTSSLLTSCVYFALVLVFAINRNNILNILGKLITPFIILFLLLIIGVGVFGMPHEMSLPLFETPIVDGLLEGYQTYDALGGVVIGSVVVLSMKLKGTDSYKQKQKMLLKSGLIAGIGLLVIYIGLVAIGALHSNLFNSEIGRTTLLSGLSINLLGNFGTIILSILIALACFSTAVSVVVGASDFIKGLIGTQSSYTLTAIVCCAIGIFVGQLEVSYIINLAVPVLLFIYPITIVLIVLNLLPERYASKQVFKSVVAICLVFSLPDVLGFIFQNIDISYLKGFIPLAEYSLGWLLPSIVTFFVVNIKSFIINLNSKKCISTSRL